MKATLAVARLLFVGYSSALDDLNKVVKGEIHTHNKSLYSQVEIIRYRMRMRARMKKEQRRNTAISE